MSDAADKAAEADERAMEQFLQKRQHRHAVPDAEQPDPDAVNCVDCGDDIPQARLKAMPRTRRCAPCAADVERR